MNIKWINERTEASGKVYWCFVPQKYLREALDVRYKRFNTVEEAAAYSAKIQDDYALHKRRVERQQYVVDSTVNGVFAHYLGQEEWLDKSDNTKRSYRLLMNTIRNSRLGSSNVMVGDMLAQNISKEHANKLHKHIRETVSRHRALHCMKLMRLVWNVARRSDRVKHNPFEKMRIKGIPPRKVLWEPEQVELFMETCDNENLPNLSLLALMCYHLCQRPGDMRQVKYKHLKDGVLSFEQEKTGTHVDLFIDESPELESKIDAFTAARFGEDKPDPEATIVLNDLTGNPHTRWSYYKQAKDIMVKAGIPLELRISDLRRTGATEMAEAGCSADELRAVTGHQSRDVLNTYVRPTKGLSRNAARRRFG